MSLKTRLQRDMHTALKAREAGRQRLSLVRWLWSAVLSAEKERGRDLDDEEVVAVLAREAKRLAEEAAEFRRAGRDDRAAQLETDLATLREYLPQPLSEAELGEIVLATIAAVGATGPADVGRVMKALMPKVQGRADGRAVSELVKSRLR